MQLDETSKMLYLQAYDRVISFDLRQHRIRAERQLAAGEHCFLHGVLPGVGAVMLVGDSTIQVWDADLKLISRHRTKGAITRFLRQDGKTFLLTRRLAPERLPHDGERPMTSSASVAAVCASMS